LALVARPAASRPLPGRLVTKPQDTHTLYSFPLVGQALPVHQVLEQLAMSVLANPYGIRVNICTQYIRRIEERCTRALWKTWAEIIVICRVVPDHS
jgi:hypothetical protein